MLNWFTWHFQVMPLLIWQNSKQILDYFYHFFSLPFLLKTIFEPWKRDIHPYENLSLADRFHVLIDNLISRFIGAVVRLGTICLGLTILLLLSISGLLSLLAWYVFPLLIIFLLYEGFYYL